MRTVAAGDFLTEKAARVRVARRATSPGPAEVDRMRARAELLPPPPRFGERLRAGAHVALIAEFKRRSPSGGVLEECGDVATTAREYVASGARALSVLTDAEDFGGGMTDLTIAASSGLPVLCKDFISDEVRLLEARLAGAAAALLIVRMLDAGELGSLLATAASLGLETLVEVHDERELHAALEASARLIGINNRDLHTLDTDLRTTERLAARVPAQVTLVSESGIRSAADVARVAAAGAHAVLVGDALLRARSGEARIDLGRALAKVRRR